MTPSNVPALGPWSPSQLSPWLAALQAGQVAAAPAEGAYGYVADAFSGVALQALIETKQRSAAKGLICLVPNVQALTLLCPPLSPAQQAAVNEYWPCATGNAVSLILPALPSLPALLTGGRPAIAVRCPATLAMQAYLQAWAKISGHGVLVSSSLNLSGQPPATSGQQVPAGIPALTTPETLSGRVSRIFDPTQGLWLR